MTMDTYAYAMIQVISFFLRLKLMLGVCYQYFGRMD